MYLDRQVAHNLILFCLLMYLDLKLLQIIFISCFFAQWEEIDIFDPDSDDYEHPDLIRISEVSDFELMDGFKEHFDWDKYWSFEVLTYYKKKRVKKIDEIFLEDHLESDYIVEQGEFDIDYEQCAYEFPLVEDLNLKFKLESWENLRDNRFIDFNILIKNKKWKTF